jgi:hypothetical protein
MHTEYDNSLRDYFIYKITSKDPAIKEGYVGKTNNIKKREWDHHSACRNVNNPAYHNKLYTFIRANGNNLNYMHNILYRLINIYFRIIIIIEKIFSNSFYLPSWWLQF